MKLLNGNIKILTHPVMFRFPKDIRYLIFEYCFDVDDGAFDRLSYMYLIKIFKFNQCLIPQLDHIDKMTKIDSRFKSFRKFISDNDGEDLHMQKIYQKITIKTSDKFKAELKEYFCSHNPILLKLNGPDEDIISEFSDLIKKSQNISVRIFGKLDILSSFKKIYELSVRNHEPSDTINQERQLEVAFLEVEDSIDEDELKNIIKEVKGVKALKFTLLPDIKLKTQLYKILPKSVTSLSIYGLDSLFTEPDKPVFRNLNISELQLNDQICEDSDISETNLFPKNLKHLKIGILPTLLTAKNRRVLPNRCLESLSIMITESTRNLSFKKNGKICSAFPDVETLTIDFSNYQFDGDDSDTEDKKISLLKLQRKIIIPKSVVNLQLIGLPHLQFIDLGILFEAPEALRSLIITNEESSYNVVHGHNFDTILAIGKLESLLIYGHPTTEIILKIPESLRILISQVPVKLTGSFKKILYMEIGD